MFPELQNLSQNEKATVYYSLGLTSSDLNRHQTAVEYYHKEMEFYTNPKEVNVQFLYYFEVASGYFQTRLKLIIQVDIQKWKGLKKAEWISLKSHWRQCIFEYILQQTHNA